jgi:hypothetical protein
MFCFIFAKIYEISQQNVFKNMFIFAKILAMAMQNNRGMGLGTTRLTGILSLQAPGFYQSVMSLSYKHRQRALLTWM